MNLVAQMADKGVRMERVEIDCPVHGTVSVFQSQIDGQIIRGSCPKCSIELSQREDEERTKKIKAQETDPTLMLQKQLSAAGVGEENLSNRFENFDSHSPILGEAVSFAKELAVGYKRYLVMFGTTGVGKTHIAVSAMALAASQKRSILYTKEPRLFREIHSTYKRKNGPSEDEVYKHFVYPDLLVIDELATEPLAKHDLMLLEELIDDRNASNKATILISNATKDEYQAHVSDKILSRIADKGRGATFQIVEKDWRRRR